MNDPDPTSGPAAYSYPPGRNGSYGYVSAGYVLILVHIPVFFGLMLSSFRVQSSIVLAQGNQPYSPSIAHRPPLPSHTRHCLIRGPDYVLG